MKVGAIVKTSFALSVIIAVFAAYMKIMHLGSPEILLIVTMISILTFIVFAIYEVRTSVRISDQEKMLWTTAFIFLGGITGLVYILIGRRRIAANY